MPKHIREVSKLLLDDHKGIPDIKVAMELCESFSRVILQKLHKDGEISIDDVGKLKVIKYNAAVKNNPKTGKLMNMPSRNVIKFSPFSELYSLLNPDKKRKKVK